MNKKLQITAVVLLVVILVMAVGSFAIKGFLDSHFFVDGKAYPNDARNLELADQNLTVEEYEQIRGQLPGCEIEWSVPFQGERILNTTTSLAVSSLSDEDLAMLKYFPKLAQIHAEDCEDFPQLMKVKDQLPQCSLYYTVAINGREYPQDAKEMELTALTDQEVQLSQYLPELTTVNAAGCTDYAQLAALQEMHPNAVVHISVEILGKTCDETTESLEFKDPDVTVLQTQLGYLPNLKSVHITEPSTDAASLVALMETYPDVDITWEKTVLGMTCSSTDKEIDFSGMDVTFDEVEAAMAYFPNAEKALMIGTNYTHEEMAEFRNKMRPKFKAVWSVVVTGCEVRTDDTIFHSSGRKVCMVDEQTYDLVYCEDMIIVDVGHSMIKYIPWVEGMPNLKYLILADNWIRDLTPISSCKNLVYLELFINKWANPDLTPLQGCTALEDLSISDTDMDPTPLCEMTWLKNLWVNNNPKAKAMREELTEALPNTRIEFDHGFTTGGGWRELQNYYDMRELMGLPANVW